MLCHSAEVMLRPLIAAWLFNSFFMYKDGTFYCPCLSVLNPVATLRHFSFTSDSFLCLRYLSPVRLFVMYAGLSFPMLLKQAFTKIWFFLSHFLHPFPKALVCSTTLWHRTPWDLIMISQAWGWWPIWSLNWAILRISSRHYSWKLRRKKQTQKL